MSGGSVGNAYLNVVPRVDGDARQLGNKFGRELSGGAKSAISAGAVALGNILADVAIKAADAVVDTFKKSMQNIMDYEQLAGGAQKIFDQIDYSVIAKDANNAFKELNMSANEYLASINLAGAAFAQTMGDEKGYAIAREGMLAISDYATGTGRNIEELNEKFQMITRSSASYQSIADQFAGILPATSKDFLEQAQAAGYLSDEYTKLTEVPVAEYQEAVTKMLTKGVDDLGLAANTLHESTGTMSGSLAMLSSAWDNFLTALGGGEGFDMTEVTNNLIAALGAVAQNIIPALGRIGMSIAVELPRIIGEGLANLAPTVREALVNAFGENAGNIFDGFIQMVESVKDVVTNAFELVSGVIEGAMPFIESVILPVVQTIASGIIASTTMIMQGISAVIDFLQAYVVPVVSAVFDFLASTVGPIVQGIADTVTSNLPAIQSIVESATNAIGEVTAAVWPVVQNIITTVANTIQSIINAVWPVIQGIVTSVFNAIQGVAQAVWPVVSAIVETAAGVIKGAIDGISTIVGVLTGIFNSAKEAIVGPIQAAADTVKGIIDNIVGFFSGLGDRISSAIGSIHFPQPSVQYQEMSLPGGGSEMLPVVSWFAKGGLVDGARLIGVGERGPELIWPSYDPYLDKYAEAIASHMGAGQTFNVYANDPALVAAVVASKQRRVYA